MIKNRITCAIKNIFTEHSGFEIYIILRDKISEQQKIKQLFLDEGDPKSSDGFKNRIRKSIEEAISKRFLSTDCQYSAGNDLANEQQHFYVIKQDENYHPFFFIKQPEEQIVPFCLSDKDNATGILFSFMIQRKGECKQLYAYQKIQPGSIPNRKRDSFQFMVKSKDQTDVFEEMKDQMFMITQKVDLLILDDEIISDEIKLLERHFKLENFLRASADRAVSSITSVGIIENEDKLKEYVARNNKKYAKKMMQICKFPVSTMSKEDLMKSLNTVERWKNVFEIHDSQIFLRNYNDVEQLIDLFTERYTKSEVTNQEYDTSVKSKVASIKQ